MIPIGDDPPPRHLFPIVTLTLIAVNIVVFIYELSVPNVDQLFRSAGVTPLEFANRPRSAAVAPLDSYFATLLTSMFLHGGFMHIGSNMLFLWIFGDNVEDRLGHLRYIAFYLLCGLGASAAHIWFNWESGIPSVGASGAIAGVLAGYLLLFPSAQIRTLLFIGVFVTVTRVPAILMIGFWFITQLLSGVAGLGQTEQTAGVAFWAHIGGFVVGLPLILALRPAGRTPAYGYR